MALLNSQNYSGLANVSSAQMKRQFGKFLPMFITGKAREGQEVDKMQCQPEIGGVDYIYHNCTEVSFIPLYIKRVWEKYIKAKSGKGEDYDQLVAFGGWADEPKIDDQCRYVYYIAGLALDQETKKVKIHEKDIENNEIKQGDKVLIYFRCAATKYQGAMDIVDELAKRSKTLPPLSDNPEFEKNIVTPRRFIIKAIVGSQKTENYGDKSVFNYEPVTMIPDKMVESIMNMSNELIPEFEKQFKTNKESQIRTRSSGAAAQPNASSTGNAPTFENTDKSDDKKADDNKNVPKDDFDLGI